MLCGRYLKGDFSDQYTAWIEGYLTRFNEATDSVDNVLHGTDIDGFEAAVESFAASIRLITWLRR